MAGPIFASTEKVMRALEGCAISGLAPASAAELASCSLLRRQETKFLIAANSVAALVQAIAADYRVAYAGTAWLARYRTLYFDTRGLHCFKSQRGPLPHHNVRIRHYDDRRLSVVEVKTKGSNTQTLKSRLAKKYGDSTLSAQDLNFVGSHSPLCGQDLMPQVWTNYSRVTLVGGAEERVTMDCDLDFVGGEIHQHVPDLVVIEVKQARFSQNTPIMRALQRLSLGPARISKYGAALALTSAHLHAATRSTGRAERYHRDFGSSAMADTEGQG